MTQRSANRLISASGRQNGRFCFLYWGVLRSHVEMPMRKRRLKRWKTGFKLAASKGAAMAESERSSFGFSTS